MSFVLKQVFEFGLFHTDPHPGNLFILPGNVIVMIDFGQVARLTTSDRAMLAELMLAIVDADASRLMRAMGRAEILGQGVKNLRRAPDMVDVLFLRVDLVDVAFVVATGGR